MDDPSHKFLWVCSLGYWPRLAADAPATSLHVPSRAICASSIYVLLRDENPDLDGVQLFSLLAQFKFLAQS